MLRRGAQTATAPPHKFTRIACVTEGELPGTPPGPRQRERGGYTYIDVSTATGRGEPFRHTRRSI